MPVPPIEGTHPPQELADADSQFVELNGIRVHYKSAGQGKPYIILLHGFAASVYSWREVIEPLAKGGMVFAFDRPAFGLTERPLEWSGDNPYSPEFQAGLVIALMDYIGAQQAILIGNSAGGSLAALTALEYPQRIRALVLVDPAICTAAGAPDWLKPLFYTP